MFQKNFVEEIKTHFVLKKFIYYRALYEIMWKNTAERTGDNMAHMHCMLDTQILTVYNIIFIAFPLQQWLHEHAQISVTCSLPALCCL